MPNKVDQIADGIRKAFEHADEWEKKRTSIPGIFIVRMPEKELRVMLMFNPPDADGNPTKKKGLYFADEETVEAGKVAFPDPALSQLVKAIGRVNERPGKHGDDSDVFEI